VRWNFVNFMIRLIESREVVVVATEGEVVVVEKDTAMVTTMVDLQVILLRFLTLPTKFHLWTHIFTSNMSCSD